MMNRLLKNKKGVTILEGLIALGLLALVAGGTFGVLLSVSRKSSQPDIREEMLLAVERANEQLQMYASGTSSSDLPTEYQNGLCNNGDTSLSSGTHDIKCMLPAICDPNNKSEFSYTVVYKTLNPAGFPTANTYRTTGFNNAQTREVTFDITCNGFTL
ncbi:MAG: hypothetical protein J6J74_04450 [Elusimicrobiaceae bacterium]|nr:hypothetical protein [Elusimicrobiaceae bacterium]MBP3513720.1 hypothetical protein [Elusimicrobiaceae bacterium]